MKKNLFVGLTMACLATSAWGADYGLPTEIQDGNILHCFDWPASEVKAELANIAAAGFGSVQISPCQRADVRVGSSWHDLYRPYDLAFKSSGYCSDQDLKDLCSEAAKYGIKIIVDVVANHVDKTSGYHDTWWDANGRVRWEGSCNYGNRYSITHGQLGDYGDINSESSEVQARAKAYVETLKSYGVKGIRWDAAKHIALPSEGCNFWSTVTSVSGMWHYGEILNDDGTPINEYTKYMSVTDNRYSDGAARYNNGIQQGYGGEWAVNRGVPSNKLVYWAESHDTYSNDEWSQNVNQDVIDRAYACVATRNGATALYLSRPNTKGFNNIKVGKGSTAFKSVAISAVNQLRNRAGAAADYCTTSNGVFSCTRQGIGAVIVKTGSGSVSIANGGGYCPTGTFKDLVSGGTFTVTSTTISGNVGSSGIAVIIKDGVTPTPGPDPDPTPDPVVGGSTPAQLYMIGNLQGASWSTSASPKMTKDGDKFTYKATLEAAAGETYCFFNFADALGADWDQLNSAANRYGAATEGVEISNPGSATLVAYLNNVDASGCLSFKALPGTYDVTVDFSTMKVSLGAGGDNPTPDPTPTPTPDGNVYVYVDGWDNVYAYVYNDNVSPTVENAAWPGVAMTKDSSTGYWKYQVPDNLKNDCKVIINTNGGPNRYPADMEPGMELKGQSMIFHVNGNSWVSGINDVMSEDADAPAEYYNLQGQKVDNPTPGIYIVRRGSKVTKAIIR